MKNNHSDKGCIDGRGWEGLEPRIPRQWEVAVDWQEPVVLQRKCGQPLPALTDIGSAVAASKHITTPINHTTTGPSPRKRSSDVTTSTKIADTRLLLTTHLSTSKG